MVVQVELYSDRFTSENCAISFMEVIADQTMTFKGRRDYCMETWIFFFPKYASITFWWSYPRNSASSEEKILRIFNRFRQHPHTIRECPACFNWSKTKWLAYLNLVWEQVDVVTHDTVRWYASYSSLSCNTGNGNTRTLLYHWTTSAFASVSAARGRLSFTAQSSLTFQIL